MRAAPQKRCLYTAPMSLHGVVPIALTPFTDGAEVDFAGIDALSGRYLASGADGLTVLGIMGEAHKLTDAERSAVAERYIAATGGEVEQFAINDPRVSPCRVGFRSEAEVRA